MQDTENEYRMDNPNESQERLIANIEHIQRFQKSVADFLAFATDTENNFLEEDTVKGIKESMVAYANVESLLIKELTDATILSASDES